MAELFVLHNMVKNAQHLNAFVSANDEQTRVLLGNQQVHEIAVGNTKDLEKNMVRLRILKSRLFNGENGTEEEVLAKGKIAHAKVIQNNLQTKLEMLYFSIARRLKEISSLAGWCNLLSNVLTCTVN